MGCEKLSNFTSHHSYHIWFNHWVRTLNHCPLRLKILFVYASICSTSIKSWKQTHFNIISRQLRFNLSDSKRRNHPPLLFLYPVCCFPGSQKLKCLNVLLWLIKKICCLIQFLEWFWNNFTFRFLLAYSTVLLDFFFVSHGNQFYLTSQKLFKYLEALCDGRSLSRSIHVVSQIFLSLFLLAFPLSLNPPPQEKKKTVANKWDLDQPHCTGDVLTSAVYAKIQVTMGTFGNYELAS